MKQFKKYDVRKRWDLKIKDNRVRLCAYKKNAAKTSNERRKIIKLALQ